MKKVGGRITDDLRPEYDLAALGRGVRGKYAGRLKGTTLIACASVIGATLLLPVAAAGEEIRVLFVPAQDIAIQFQARALERAIAENSHSVRVVKDLADAHVLLQFTDYRVERRKKDGPLRWWHGTAKVLLPADAASKDAALALRLPERFALVIMGDDGGTEIERTAEALERFLRKALGRDGPKRSGEAI